jgi:HlyD family secretion protein
MRTCFIAISVGLVSTVGVAYYATRPAREPSPSLPASPATLSTSPAALPTSPVLPTAKVQRGNLVRAINVKGTVKLDEVEVGTQATGMIASFGKDPADPSKALDCGSHVRRGMVLAQIDPTIYEAQVNYADAALAAAKCSLAQLQARRDQTERAWKRAQSLRAKSAIAETDYDLAATDFRMATANVASGEAAVHEAEAMLHIAKTNLDYTVIKAPSDGVIIDRRVNIGQTVVAPLNAPGLFLIAKDSPQVQVWASVDETDIGDIHPGQPARFTVKACMDEVFDGKVAQVRMNPVKHDAATTYTVVVAAENRGAMLPDMSVDLQFEVEHHPGVLLIPNNAIPPTPKPPSPSDGPVAPNTLAAHPKDSTAISLARLSGERDAVRHWKEQRNHHHLWVKDGKQVHTVDVQVGSSNGAMTEIMGKDVHEGMEVVLGDIRPKSGI